jgi:Fungal specific transcription factor domain
MMVSYPSRMNFYRKSLRGWYPELHLQLYLLISQSRSDLSYSTTWDLSPSLPLLTTGICRASISEYVLYFSQYFSPETEIYSPHDLVGEISDIFQAMRLLSLCVRSPPSDWWRRKVFDRGLYISEYKLLVVLDDQDDMGDEVVVPNRNSHIYGSCRLAAYLYLYIALREIPPSAATNQAIVKRLKGILESISVCLLTVWMEDRELFLWILYMGAVSALETAERAFFVKVLRKLIVPMGLDTMEAFTGTLKKVLWEPGFCEQDSTTRDLWEEIQRV